MTNEVLCDLLTAACKAALKFIDNRDEVGWEPEGVDTPRQLEDAINEAEKYIAGCKDSE